MFLIDELLVFGAVVVTMRATKMQEHHGQMLQLIGGTLMLTLAVAMIAAPDLLETLSGTAVVFGLAAGACALVILIESLWAHHAGSARRSGPKPPRRRGFASG